jgi:hypothetical protein
MKKSNFNKKLPLNKRTIANLNVRELHKARGGATETTCFETCPETCDDTCECQTNDPWCTIISQCWCGGDSWERCYSDYC